MSRSGRLGGCAVLTFGLILGLAGPAPARGTVTPSVSHVVASWGDN